MSKRKRIQPKRPADWRRIVGQWRKSGLSVREFCRRHKISETSFYQGRRGLGTSKASSGRKPVKDKFVEVNLTPLPDSPACLEIIWTEPPVVKIHPGCDAALLREALGFLAKQAC